MSENFLKDFPTLHQKVLRGHSPEWVETLTPETWESRIEPILNELVDKKDVFAINFTVDRHEVYLMSNDRDLLEFTAGSARRMGFVPRPSFHLYVFNGVTDRMLLRRFKEFPDETPREELEAYWAAYCPEAQSAVVLNSNR